MKTDRNSVLRLLRIVGYAVLAAITPLLALFLFKQLAVPLIVWSAPSLETPFYDLGFFGPYRTSKYHSFDLKSPKASTLQWEESCGNGYILIDPNGPSVDHRGPTILDAQGNLVWTSDQFETTTNLKIQQYQGQDYLTFWSGQKAKTMGTGTYYMLDSNYNIVRQVDAAGESVRGDLHEFKITEQGTALLTVYNTTNADLTAMGWFRTEQGWIIDSVFQEVDIKSGELLFEWRASEHFDAVDSYMTNPFGGYYESAPFDFFHINSIDKDVHGNYLISSRHFHAIYYIDGVSGEVLWTFGGRNSDFTDLSDGSATDFSWQHDARWVSQEEGLISLFDNSMAWPHVDADYSRGMIVQLDLESRTASLVHEYISLQQARSSSQGSVQIVPGADGQEHVFIGWGSSAAYSEFAPDGTLLCETHFAASWFYWWERVKSYRAFKASDWVGVPAAWDPSAKSDGKTLYISWNGATEVAFWELQGARVEMGSSEDDAEFEDIDVIEKERFEESFALPSGKDAYSHYRVAALDRDRNVLRYSNVTTARSAGVWGYVFAAFAAVGCMGAMGAYWVCRRRGVHWNWTSSAGIDRSKYRKL